MNHTKKFLKLINEEKFEQASKYLKENFYFIDKDYKDEQGNTFMHLVVYKVGEKLPNKPNYNDDYGCSNYKDFEELVKTMLQHNFDYKSKNIAGNLAIDNLLISLDTEKMYDRRNAVKEYLIELFEKKGEMVFSGTRYVENFDFFRSSKKLNKTCEIYESKNISYNPKLSIHQELALAHNYRNHPYGKNIATANIGFVISDIDEIDRGYHKRIFVTFPIVDKNYSVIRDSDTKNYTYPLYDSHAEAKLCGYLCNKDNLPDLLRPLYTKYSPKMKYIRSTKTKYGAKYTKYHIKRKIYEIVLDIHSTMTVCSKCIDKLHVLQIDKNNSFLRNVTDFLRNRGYEFPKKDKENFSSKASGYEKKPRVPLLIRVSSQDVWKWDIKDASKEAKERKFYPTVTADFFTKDTKKIASDTIFHSIYEKINKNTYERDYDPKKLNPKNLNTVLKDKFKDKNIKYNKRTFFSNDGMGTNAINNKWEPNELHLTEFEANLEKLPNWVTNIYK